VRPLLVKRAVLEAAPPSVAEALRSPAQPLDAGARRHFERAFGHDLSHIRVHTGSAADAAARAVDANAFTTSADIVFRAGAYAPGTRDGLRLLAHELTHVVQDETAADAGGNGLIRRSAAGATALTDPAEHEAQRAETDPGELMRQLIAVVLEIELVATTGYAKPDSPAKADTTGMAAPESLAAFAGDLRTVQKNWNKTLPKQPKRWWQRKQDPPRLASARNRRLGEALNARLGALSIPLVEMDATELSFPGARFRPLRWVIEIDASYVKGGAHELSDEGAGEIAEAVLHEGRHAEQSFLAARYLATQNPGWPPLWIAVRLRIPIRIARAAKRQPLKGEEPSFALAEAMGNAYTGTRTNVAGKRKKTQRQGDAGDIMDTIKQLDKTLSSTYTQCTNMVKTLKRLPHNESTIEKGEQLWKNARAQLDRRAEYYAEYRALPDEMDAWPVGKAAHRAFDASGTK
jgi:hypothetical protein